MSENHTFQTFKPKDSRISQYISYYYFHQSNDEDYSKSFTFFPNYKHGLTAYLNSEINITQGENNVHPCGSKMTVLYTMNYNQSYKVNLKGPFNKIGIAFEVGGLNNFMKSDLEKYYNDENHTFNYFGDEFEIVLKNVFNNPNYDEKIALLDHFFVEKLTPFKDSIVLKIAEDIVKSNGTIKLEELSVSYSMNRKKIFRLFQKHFCCSPEAYKKMVKFRNTLNFTQSHSDFKSLTEISLFNHYYDQSDFNKQFKSITNKTPKEILSKIEKIGEEDTYWIFES